MEASWLSAMWGHLEPFGDYKSRDQGEAGLSGQLSASSKLGKALSPVTFGSSLDFPRAPGAWIPAVGRGLSEPHPPQSHARTPHTPAKGPRPLLRGDRGSRPIWELSWPGAFIGAANHVSDTGWILFESGKKNNSEKNFSRLPVAGCGNHRAQHSPQPTPGTQEVQRSGSAAHNLLPGL